MGSDDPSDVYSTELRLPKLFMRGVIICELKDFLQLVFYTPRLFVALGERLLGILL